MYTPSLNFRGLRWLWVVTLVGFNAIVTRFPTQASLGYPQHANTLRITHSSSIMPTGTW